MECGNRFKKKVVIVIIVAVYKQNNNSLHASRFIQKLYETSFERNHYMDSHIIIESPSEVL